MFVDESYKPKVKDVENIATRMYDQETLMSTPAVLARNLEEGALPCYNTGTELEGFSQPGPLVRQHVVNNVSLNSYLDILVY